MTWDQRDEELFPSTPRARDSDPDTSHQAAASVTNVTAGQMAILWLFTTWGQPMTDVELLEHYRLAHKRWGSTFPRQSDSGVRTRRSELVRAGVLVDSGLIDVLPSGRSAIRWMLTDAGWTRSRKGADR